MKCNPQTTEIRAGWYRHHCPVCQRSVESPGARLTRICTGKPDGPGIIQTAKNVSVAYAKWMAAGFPKRSEDRVKEILETHCKPCRYYNAEKGNCRLCGCPVSEKGLRNKLLWATERCPDNPPKWVEECEETQPNPQALA